VKAITASASVSNSFDALHAAHRLLALAGVNAARVELAAMALQTDAPDWRDVEAADLLDAAHKRLARVLP